MIKATVYAMKVLHEADIAVEMVDRSTGDTYSANPGDYWGRDLGAVFTDGNGDPMILTREIITMDTLNDIAAQWNLPTI